jgi:hypothetical protein
MLPHRLRSSLALAQWVGAATLLRSVIYDRWITVVASILLITGAYMAQRGKTWGVGVTLGAGIAFAAAFAIGIAPAWFVAVGLIGAMPFLLTSRSLARFDAAAATIGASLAAAVGVAGAVGWKVIAPWLFYKVPALSPSWDANHLGLVAAIATTVGVVAAARALNTKKEESAPHVRIASEAETAPAYEEALEELDDAEFRSASVGQRRSRG